MVTCTPFLPAFITPFAPAGLKTASSTMEESLSSTRSLVAQLSSVSMLSFPPSPSIITGMLTLQTTLMVLPESAGAESSRGVSSGGTTGTRCSESQLHATTSCCSCSGCRISSCSSTRERESVQGPQWCVGARQ